MVNSFVKRGIQAFTAKQTNILSAALFIIVTTILSQLLGLLKYRLLVSFFGASSDVGVFFASFRIPDFLFQVVIAGALSSAFIPVLSDLLAKNKKKEAFEFTSSLLSIGLIVFCVLSILIVLFSYHLSSLVAPGFSKKELALMANLTRIIQLSELFFMVGTVMTAMLQSFQHFLIPGIASSFYNLGIIVGLLLFARVFGIYGAAIGVLLGSVFFCLVQLPLLIMTGYRYFPNLSLKTGVLKVFHLMVPRSLTLVVSQIATTANVFFASFLSARSLVIFDLAQTLVLAPVVLLGQSIAQASFPTLSLKSEEREEFVSLFTTALNQILYLTLPISAILIVLRIPAVRLFYGARQFDWQATVDTGLTLSFFSFSIFAQALIYLLSRAFYALKDTKTPFLITTISVALNIVLAYVFLLVYRLPIYYLALASSVGNIVALLLMVIFLNKRLALPKFEILFSVSKIVIATIVMGVALYIPIKLLDRLVFDTTRTINLIMLTGIASFFGLASYVFFTWLLDIREAYYIVRVVKSLGNREKILKQVGELIGGESKLNP